VRSTGLSLGGVGQAVVSDVGRRHLIWTVVVAAMKLSEKGGVLSNVTLDEFIVL